jgi:hypothetical protein
MPSTIVWIQKWEESERGWGTRPDGYTIHSRKEDIDNFLKAMRAREKEHYGDTVPDEYSRPDGDPYQAEILDGAVIAELFVSQYGIWGANRNNYPKPINP